MLDFRPGQVLTHEDCSRRRFLRFAARGGLAFATVPLLLAAACGDDDDDDRRNGDGDRRNGDGDRRDGPPDEPPGQEKKRN